MANYLNPQTKIGAGGGRRQTFYNPETGEQLTAAEGKELQIFYGRDEQGIERVHSVSEVDVQPTVRPQDVSLDPNEATIAAESQRLGLSYSEITDLRRQASGGITGDLGVATATEQGSFAERTALDTTGTGTPAESYWDAGRGVQVRAPAGKHFELFPGGGVKVVEGPAPEGAGAPASSLFTQPTRGTAGGGTEAVPGFKEEKLAYQPIQGKEIARTGQTIKNPTTGVDEYAGPGEVLIEYSDGTVERRKVGSAPGSAVPIGEFGRTAAEVGITRQTEVKGGAGPEVTRAPLSAAQALAAAQTPEEKNAIIQAEDLTGTQNLEFIGTEYTDQETGARRIAKEGNAFYQDPATNTILERPIAIQSLAKETTSPSILAERAAAQAQVSAGGLPTFSDSLKSNFQGLGLSLDENAAIQALRDRPIPSVQELYTAIQQAQGVSTIQAQLKTIQDEMKALDDKYATDKASIDENPWLSESLRDRKQDALAGKYETQRSQLVNRQQLNQSLLQDARQEAQFIAGTAIQQANADRQFDLNLLQTAFERADQRFNAQIQLAQFQQGQKEFTAEQQFRERQLAIGQEESAADREFRERQFNEDIRQFNVQQSRLSRGGGGRARQPSSMDILEPGINTIASHLETSKGQDGYADPGIYTMERLNFAAIGVDPADFDQLFSTYLSPAERTRVLGDVYRVPKGETATGPDYEALVDQELNRITAEALGIKTQ